MFSKTIKSNFPNYNQEKLKAFNKELEINPHPYCESLFKVFGAETVDSVDYSDYENATIIHDMQVPIPDSLKNKFSLVWDGGLLEHVFDYPAALRNTMDMVEVGGLIALETPANNYLGHGFYQLQPEIFFSILRKENGFDDTHVFSKINGKWYEHKNPRELKYRTEFHNLSIFNRSQWTIRVVSRKISDTPAKLTAFQSDYESAWEESKTGANKPTTNNESFVKKVYKSLPLSIRQKIRASRFVQKNIELPIEMKNLLTQIDEFM